MKLNFEISPDYAMLEARELDRMYSIFQMGDKCDAVVNGEHLISGDLYECLDVCNQHASDILNILNIKELDVEKELAGCSYERVFETVFKDHKGEELTIVRPKRFKSIEEVKNFIQWQAEDAVVYVYDLQECYFSNGVSYYLKYVIRSR